MNEWMVGLVHGWKGRWVDGWMDQWVGKWMDGCVSEQVSGAPKKERMDDRISGQIKASAPV